jgi:hypothetical protein
MMNGLSSRLIALLVLVGLMFACGGTAPATVATVAPPADTPTAAATAEPTSTPDAAATAKVENFAGVLGTFQDKGYITATNGTLYDLQPFESAWAQLGWYQWEVTDEVDNDFVFAAHYKWESATNAAEPSGCGLTFGIQSNQDHYAMFVDRSRIVFLMSRGGTAYEVGKTSGSGRLDYSNPAEADVALGVVADKAYVSVDNKFTTYTLSKDQSTRGEFGFSILSGTNRDFGTRCEVTDPVMWVAE